MNSRLDSDNAQTFSFSDFTVENYRGLLRLAKGKGYTSISYSEYQKHDNWVIWRHDIDFSPHRALQMAKVEKEEGVRSTYFLLPHSRFYNLFEKRCTDIILEILDLGHDIGLHFDCGYYQVGHLNESVIEEKVQFEKGVLQHIFNVPIDSFSFHTPEAWAVQWGKEKVGGCVNAYSKFFMNNVGYASDSNGIWRHDSIAKRIDDGNSKLQLLTHPVWWTEEVSSPKERFFRAIDGRSNALIMEHQEHWIKINRPLIDWK